MSHHRAPNADFHHLFHTTLDREVMEVCGYQLLFNMARNLAVLSLVYHLFVNLNYLAWQVCLFFLVGMATFAVSVLFSAKIIEWIGVKHTMAIRPVVAGLYYIGLMFFLGENFWLSLLLIFPFNIIRSIGSTGGQIAYDVFLSHHLTKENRGESLAWLQIAIMISTVTAPIIGGFVTKYAGFNWTIGVSIVLFALAAVVLLLTPDEKFKLPYKFGTLATDLFKNTPKALYASEFGRTFFDSVLFIIWPLFLVLVLTDIAEIGVIAGLSSGVAMIVAFWVGKQVDKQQGSSARLVRNGALRSTCINIVRGLWWEPITLGVVDAISKINDQTIKLPYDVEFYKWVKSHNSLERTHIRQILFQWFYLICFTFYLILFLLFPTAPAWTFFLIFVSSALTLTLCANIAKVSLSDRVEK